MCTERVNNAAVIYLSPYKRQLYAQLNAIKSLLVTMSANDDRFQSLMQEKEEILQQLNPEKL